MTAPDPLPRRRMEHPTRSNAFTRAMLLVIAAFVGGFALFVAMTVAGIDQHQPIPQVIAKGIVLLWAGSIVYSLWTYISLRIFRCPTCGEKTARVDDAYPAIHKYCAACNVEWITGLAISQSVDD